MTAILTDLCVSLVGSIHEGRGSLLVLDTGKALLPVQDITNSVQISYTR